jgi:hypothetical protein
VRFNQLPMMKAALFVIPGLLAPALAFVVDCVQGCSATAFLRNEAQRKPTSPVQQLSVPHAEVGTCEIQ